MITLSYYSLLSRIRPAQLGDIVKRCLRIQRQNITANGHVFWVDPVSVFGDSLSLKGVYEPEMTKLLQLLLKENDIFLDVGGNEGYFSVIAASQIGPKGRVFCIEPQSRLKEIIRRNMVINYCADRVKICHQALNSGESKTVRLFLRPSSNTGASSMFRHWKLGSASEVVAAISLDEFWATHQLIRAKLMKVDCEGAEHLVIDGAIDTLRAKRLDFIVIDYHTQIVGPRRCQQTHDLLIEQNYILSKAQGLSIYHLPGLEQQLAPLGAIKVNCNWDQ